MCWATLWAIFSKTRLLTLSVKLNRYRAIDSRRQQKSDKSEDYCFQFKTLGKTLAWIHQQKSRFAKTAAF
jgi:hypothetical protein